MTVVFSKKEQNVFGVVIFSITLIFFLGEFVNSKILSGLYFTFNVEKKFNGLKK